MQPKFHSLMFRFGIYIFQDVNLVCPKHELLYHIHLSMDCPDIWSIESYVLYLGAAQFSEHNIQFWHFYYVYGILLPKQPSQCSNQGGLRTAIKYQGLFFFKLTSGCGLTNYVSRHLSIYGNSISIFG